MRPYRDRNSRTIKTHSRHIRAAGNLIGHISLIFQKSILFTFFLCFFLFDCLIADSDHHHKIEKVLPVTRSISTLGEKLFISQKRAQTYYQFWNLKMEWYRINYWNKSFDRRYRILHRLLILFQFGPKNLNFELKMNKTELVWKLERRFSWVDNFGYRINFYTGFDLASKLGCI